MENSAMEITKISRVSMNCATRSANTAWPEPDEKELLVSLYRNYHKPLKKIVARYRLEDVVIEDILQETFLKAMLHLDKLRNRSAVFPWLCSIAKNLCLLELRKNRRFTLTPVLCSSTADDDGSGSYELALKADDVTASMKLEYSLTLLRGMIENHQHAVRRDVARRFYVEEKSVKEIAEECCLNQNTILSHLRRFRGLITDAMLRAADEFDLATCPERA